MGQKTVYGLTLTLLYLLLGVSLCRADLLFAVSLDTSLLEGNPAQPFFVEFQLNDGSGTSDANNTAMVSNFDFGGGSPTLTISTTGGASGNVDAGVEITDSGFFNQFFQEFTPGDRLTFDVSLTQAIDVGPQPDQFSFAILDCSQTEIPTTSPANALVAINIDANSTIHTFSGDTNRQLACNGSPGIALPAPRVTGVPEPQTLELFAIALFTACWFVRSSPRADR